MEPSILEWVLLVLALAWVAIVAIRIADVLEEEREYERRNRR